MLEITLATEGRPSSARQKKTLKQEAEDRPRWPVSSGGKHWVFLNEISDSLETDRGELI